MVTFLLFIGLGTVVIIGVEFAMWRIFASKAQGLPLLRGADESSLPFFTISSLRAVAFVHAVLMLVVLYLLSFYYW